mmetsp:Transcript_9248/g.25929  ORF Transcript_9248/g.25929 Transcript_9248/m.25929 type:complete len:262 (+) Transcript_9248:766-1551(+)
MLRRFLATSLPGSEPCSSISSQACSLADCPSWPALLSFTATEPWSRTIFLLAPSRSWSTGRSGPKLSTHSDSVYGYLFPRRASTTAGGSVMWHCRISIFSPSCVERCILDKFSRFTILAKPRRMPFFIPDGRFRAPPFSTRVHSATRTREPGSRSTCCRARLVQPAQRLSRAAMAARHVAVSRWPPPRRSQAATFIGKRTSPAPAQAATSSRSSCTLPSALTSLWSVTGLCARPNRASCGLSWALPPSDGCAGGLTISSLG